jgi:hypothetical protein
MSAGMHVYGTQFLPGTSITEYFDGSQMNQTLGSSGVTIPAGTYELMLQLEVAASSASGWHTVTNANTPTSAMKIAEVQVYAAPEEVDETNEKDTVARERRREEEGDGAKTTASNASPGSASVAKGVCRESAGLRCGHPDLVYRGWQRRARGDPKTGQRRLDGDSDGRGSD